MNKLNYYKIARLTRFFKIDLIEQLTHFDIFHWYIHSIEIQTSTYDALQLLNTVFGGRTSVSKYHSIRLYRKINHFHPIIQFYESGGLNETDPHLSRSKRTMLRIYIATAYFRTGNVQHSFRLMDEWKVSEIQHRKLERLRATMILEADPHKAISIFESGNIYTLPPTQFALYLSLKMHCTDYEMCSTLLDTYGKRQKKARLPELLLLKIMLIQNFGKTDVLEKAILALSSHFCLGENLLSFSPTALYNTSRSYRGLNTAASEPYKVTVIVTAYNTGPLIDLSIFSLLSQTYRNIEILIVDDASDDPATTTRIAEWEDHDPRIRTIRMTVNGGTYKAKNYALAFATGDLITFHDSDDWAHPDRLREQVNCLYFQPHLKATQSQWFRVSATGEPILKRWGSFIHTNPASLMIRRNVIREIGKFDDVRIGADTEFVARIRAAYGNRQIAVIEKPLTVGFARSSALTNAGIGAIDKHGYNAWRLAYWNSWLEWHLSKVPISGATDYFYDPDKSGERPFTAPSKSI